MAAVMFLDEDFYLTNAVGLGVLILGVFWFNYTKYKKVAAGEIKPAKSGLEPYKEDAHDVVRPQPSCMSDRDLLSCHSRKQGLGVPRDRNVVPRSCICQYTTSGGDTPDLVLP